MPLLKNLRTLTFSSFRGDLSKLLPELYNLTCLNLNYDSGIGQYLVKNAKEFTDKVRIHFLNCIQVYFI